MQLTFEEEQERQRQKIVDEAKVELLDSFYSFCLISLYDVSTIIEIPVSDKEMIFWNILRNMDNSYNKIFTNSYHDPQKKFATRSDMFEYINNVTNGRISNLIKELEIQAEVLTKNRNLGDGKKIYKTLSELDETILINIFNGLSYRNMTLIMDTDSYRKGDEFAFSIFKSLMIYFLTNKLMTTEETRSIFFLLNKDKLNKIDMIFTFFHNSKRLPINCPYNPYNLSIINNSNVFDPYDLSYYKSPMLRELIEYYLDNKIRNDKKSFIESTIFQIINNTKSITFDSMTKKNFTYLIGFHFPKYLTFLFDNKKLFDVEVIVNDPNMLIKMLERGYSENGIKLVMEYLEEQENKNNTIEQKAFSHSVKNFAVLYAIYSHNIPLIRTLFTVFKLKSDLTFQTYYLRKYINSSKIPKYYWSGLISMINKLYPGNIIKSNQGIYILSAIDAKDPKMIKTIIEYLGYDTFTLDINKSDFWNAYSLICKVSNIEIFKLFFNAIEKDRFVFFNNNNIENTLKYLIGNSNAYFFEDFLKFVNEKNIPLENLIINNTQLFINLLSYTLSTKSNIPLNIVNYFIGMIDKLTNQSKREIFNSDKFIDTIRTLAISGGRSSQSNSNTVKFANYVFKLLFKYLENPNYFTITQGFLEKLIRKEDFYYFETKWNSDFYTRLSAIINQANLGYWLNQMKQTHKKIFPTKKWGVEEESMEIDKIYINYNGKIIDLNYNPNYYIYNIKVIMSQTYNIDITKIKIGKFINVEILDGVTLLEAGVNPGNTLYVWI